MKAHLQDLLREALAALGGDVLSGIELPAELPVERTRDAKNGDYASNIAMQLAKPARRKPRELAELIVARLPASANVARVEIAGPGFINFFQSSAASLAVVGEILDQGPAFGQSTLGQRRKVLVEFVSANPTGPMHVGHGRGAAYGDTVANLLKAVGYAVTKEYYVNDAGRQVDVLAISVWLRYLELSGAKAPAFPKRAYPADYITQIAESYRAQHGDAQPLDIAGLELPADPEIPSDADNETQKALKDQQEQYLDAMIKVCKQALGNANFQSLKRFSLDSQLDHIKATLKAFNVNFDNWVSEQDVVSSGASQRAYEKLQAAGLVKEEGGAKWLDTERFGDEKPRVLYKADGAATYFANDLAYHELKLERGFDLLVNVWGADHHGYVARVRAAIEALTGRKDVLNVQLVQFVTLSSGRMGKRSGNFVTFDDLVSEAGKDATRFFYLLRGNDQHLEFDIELARSQTNENPVYYVQYAHARICSVERQMGEKGFSYDAALALASLDHLTEAHEQALLTQLARYPELLEQAALQYAPHALVHYLRDLADHFHSYYNAHQFLVEDAALRNARLALVMATRQVLNNALDLLGVTAPTSMFKESNG
jgi:arginyl-tRNA synthetase